MKKAILVLALFCATLTQPAAMFAEEIVFGYDAVHRPFSYILNGEALGFDVDLAQAIFEGSKYQVEYRPSDNLEQLHAALSSGAVDISSGLLRTPLRDKMFIFAQVPAVVLRALFFVDETVEFTHPMAMRGAVTSVVGGSAGARILEEVGGFRIRTYPTKDEALQALWAGETEAYFGYDMPAYESIGRNKMKTLHALGAPFAGTPVYFALYRDNEGLRRFVERRLRELVAEGEYDDIYRKWFVDELNKQELTELMTAAREASVNGRARRGNRKVGAAIISRSGRIFTGQAVETEVEGYGLEAVESAVASAVAQGDLEVRAVAVVAENGELLMPTANERQLLHEFGRGVLIVVERQPGRYETAMVSLLLPHAKRRFN